MTGVDAVGSMTPTDRPADSFVVHAFDGELLRLFFDLGGVLSGLPQEQPVRVSVGGALGVGVREQVLYSCINE